MKTHRTPHAAGPWITRAVYSILTIRFYPPCRAIGVSSQIRRVNYEGEDDPVRHSPTDQKPRSGRVRRVRPVGSPPWTIQDVLRLPALRLFSFIQDKKSIEPVRAAIASHRGNRTRRARPPCPVRPRGWKWKTAVAAVLSVSNAAAGEPVDFCLGRNRRFLHRWWTTSDGQPWACSSRYPPADARCILSDPRDCGIHTVPAIPGGIQRLIRSGKCILFSFLESIWDSGKRCWHDLHLLAKPDDRAHQRKLTAIDRKSIGVTFYRRYHLSDRIRLLIACYLISISTMLYDIRHIIPRNISLSTNPIRCSALSIRAYIFIVYLRKKHVKQCACLAR